VADAAPDAVSDVVTASMVGVLEDLVMAETPSNDSRLLRVGTRLAATIVHRLLGEVPEVVEVEGRQHLRLRGRSLHPILVLCHLDTVWPAGTTARWPFGVTEGRASGPGVFDMKAGLVQGLYALSSVGCPDEVTLLITTDEEIGSPTSRSLIEEEAREARAVLVLEPSLDGAFKVGRKGVSMYQLVIQGRAAHAGLEPDRGVNAVVELARQILDVVEAGDGGMGTTVTPTTVAAVSSRNTVPARAALDIDARAWTGDEQRRVHARLSALRPYDSRAQLALSGGVNRPPLEEDQSIALASLADRCVSDLALRPCGRARVGGGSDGNFTASLGIPTLDGMGAVGANAHAEGEYADTTYLVERATLVRTMLERIADGWLDKAAADQPQQ